MPKNYKRPMVTIKFQLWIRPKYVNLSDQKPITAAQLDMGAGHLHPLNFALGLAKAAQDAGVKIYEQSEVTNVESGNTHKVTTVKGHVNAAHLIYACNGYLGHLQGKVAAKVMPINNFIVATEPLGKDMAESLISRDVAIADSKFVVNYFRRSADNRMLFGGGETYGYRFPRDIKALVSKPMLEVYPQLADVKLDYAWGGTLGITINRMPSFMRLSPTSYSLSGYSGHGVGMATMAGKIVARAIQGQAEQFDTMTSVPSPSFPGGTALRWPGLVLAMTWYSMRGPLGHLGQIGNIFPLQKSCSDSTENQLYENRN